jgi:thioredoxin 1
MGVLSLTKENIKEHTSSGVALIDFWAPWCGPCRALTPVVEELAEEMGDRVTIAKINCDDEKELAQEFKIRSIPAIFILKDGEVVESFIGIRSKEDLEEALNKAAGAGDGGLDFSDMD